MNIWVTSNAIGLPLGPIVGGFCSPITRGAGCSSSTSRWSRSVWWRWRCTCPSRGARARSASIPGIALSSTGLVALIYGLIEAGAGRLGERRARWRRRGRRGTARRVPAWERRSTHPLIDVSLFSNRDFTVGTALATVANFALFGLLFVMPQYFQGVGGSDPLGTGVRLLPMIGGMIVATRIGPMPVEARGPRFVIITGLALMAAALGLAATTEVDTGYAFAALWITLLGAGIGLVAAGLGGRGPRRAVAGPGRLRLRADAGAAQVGGTIGVAVLGTVLSSGYPHGSTAATCPVGGDAVRSSVGAGIEVAHRLDSSALAQTVRSAFVHGMDTVLWPPRRLRSWVPWSRAVPPRRLADPPADRGGPPSM